ncbi:carbamoyltransferase [Actinoplanes sp. SE50]|uniref:carbamoyltransferase family protein n=1 Tax=unclassified Actinoplanes TaxID=2626549 RepID=UPI00023EBEB6|nr:MULTISPECIES: carbamoyltransferase C-terminal domain-containing protein [unclassified Actinoplanes]AEV82932.1 carbamoyltransferase [Actinoplanes sp. SE50/110]ATO81328.1 carbamoyltransferase [Actinoplanes sp. SE50]SLL98735.1 carbamoyltransferase [Actinoplanes sp. SE50/110]
MLILGWHGGIRPEWDDLGPGWSTHDGAAVLLRDGQIVAAVEEERLNRVKHSNFFPARAIARCLEIGGVRLPDVDVVAMNFQERTREIFPADAGLPSPNAFLDDPSSGTPTVRDALREIFDRHFATDVADRLHFCHHHQAHLWSAWGPSGFPEALGVSIDGSGDALSGMVARAGEAGLEVLREWPVPHSLGDLYSDSIRLLGYRRFDEYKVMGLAPYGDPRRFRSLFEQFYELRPEGGFRLATRAERWGLIHDAGLLPLARRSGQPFTTLHSDFAAGLQEALETVVLHVIRHFATSTGLRRMVYAGGVAHNCTLNGRLLHEGLFDEVYVQPAAHDAGGALGAALHADHVLGGGGRAAMPHLSLGTDLPSASRIADRLAAWSGLVEVTRLTDPIGTTARELAGGAVVGWVHGRSEFGPRALGNRSILADPRPAGNKSRINEMVKKREGYRPFAPSVLQEHLAGLVEMPAARADLSFMTYTLTIRAEHRELLGAVTHVDGSARVQSVSRSRQPRYWALIDAFRELTGVPALLNTSFNNNAEPIADSVDDSVVCFLTTGIDLLVVDDFLVRRRPGLDLAEQARTLCPGVPLSRKLVSRPAPDGSGFHHSIEATASAHFVQQRVDVSAGLHRVLSLADGRSTVAELCSAAAVTEAAQPGILRELITVWERRAVTMRPSGSVRERA